MAINRETLRIRAITALVFVLIMFAGLFINEWSFFLLFSIIMFGCLYEFSAITRKISRRSPLRYMPLAFLYIILPVLLMIDLGLHGGFYTHSVPSRNLSGYSSLLPCAIIFSIWINDTMAYLVGSVIGKTPFSKISPKKTWEGTIGGTVLSVVSMALLGPLFSAGKGLSWQHWTAIAAICSVFGTAGDLLESKLKRMANVKDSGSIMPGHGGFLDRFDSLLVATPFVWLYISLFL